MIWCAASCLNGRLDLTPDCLEVLCSVKKGKPELRKKVLKGVRGSFLLQAELSLRDPMHASNFRIRSSSVRRRLGDVVKVFTSISRTGCGCRAAVENSGRANLLQVVMGHATIQLQSRVRWHLSYLGSRQTKESSASHVLAVGGSSKL